MAYCYNCGVNHRTGCPKDKQTQTECPQCGQAKKIPQDDYMCKTCRLQAAPKYTLHIPEISLQTLRQEEVNTLTGMLLKHGVGFTVVPE